MRNYRITDQKIFMQKLLMTDAFQDYLLLDAEIVMGQKYHIEGRLDKRFWSSQEWEDRAVRPHDYAAWEDMKPIVLQMIKGKKTPVSMKIVLILKPELMQTLLQDALAKTEQNLISGLTCIIHFDEKGLYIMSGVSYEGFLLNKEPEQKWDLALKDFLEKCQIPWEE